MSIYPQSYFSWKIPSKVLPLLSQKAQCTWDLQGSLGHLKPTPTSTSGYNGSLLIILTDQGLHLLKHKNVATISSKFLLPFGKRQDL